MSSVAITGLGAVTALGPSVADTWAALMRGENGIRPLRRFDTRALASNLGATVPGQLGAAANRPLAFALAAGREALADAGLATAEARCALVLGTSLGSSRGHLSGLADAIGDGLGATGPRIVISTACSSSTHAVGLGRDLLVAGEADVVLAGGTDELTPDLFAGFCALGVVSPKRCAPFSEPVGTSIGEGAGFVVLESAARAAARGRSPHAWVRGYGLSADAHHATSPDPTGSGVRRAIRGALADADLTPDTIDYVNAHGTGTAANDPAEAMAIEATLAVNGRQPLISSSKSFLGHAQGAAGILELIVTVVGMGRSLVPCTMGFTKPRPRCPTDPIADQSPRVHPFSGALSLNSAFGGANAAVVVTRQRGDDAPSPGRRPIVVAGAGLVGPGAATLSDLDDAALPLSGAAPAVRVQQVVRGVDPRGVDRTTALLAGAVKQALDGAAMDLTGQRRDRVGLFVGQTRVAREAEQEFVRTIDQRGLARLSAPAFAKLVLNAAAGALTRMFGLRGAVTALCTGSSSGVCTVALAADYLARRNDLDGLIVAGVSQAIGEPGENTEGACALVLTRHPHTSAWAEVTGWALGSRGTAATLTSRAREKAGIPNDCTIPLVASREVSDDVGGLNGALACALAADRTRRGEAPAVLVLDDRGSAAAAVVFSPLAPQDGGDR